MMKNQTLTFLAMVACAFGELIAQEPIASEFVVMRPQTTVCPGPEVGCYSRLPVLPRGYTFSGYLYGNWVFAEDAGGFLPVSSVLQISRPKGGGWLIPIPIRVQGITYKALIVRTYPNIKPKHGLQEHLDATAVDDGRRLRLFDLNASSFDFWKLEAINDIDNDGTDDFLLSIGLAPEIPGFQLFSIISAGEKPESTILLSMPGEVGVDSLFSMDLRKASTKSVRFNEKSSGIDLVFTTAVGEGPEPAFRYKAAFMSFNPRERIWRLEPR